MHYADLVLSIVGFGLSLVLHQSLV